MTLQKAKIQIVKNKKKRDGNHNLITDYDTYTSIYGTPEWLVDEVAELYARSKWDEAIKEYEKLNNLDVSYYDKPEFKP